MKAIFWTTVLALPLILGVNVNGKEKSMKQIRTYMSWSQPIDPAKIITIVDMDLSYGLASTLVEWDQKKQIRKGLAEKWEIVGEKTYRFTLRPNQKWSDGTDITCAQVKASFERGLAKHPDDLRSLANILERIECKDQNIDFVLKSKDGIDGLLGKLTEPNYGVLKVEGDAINLAMSSGPFSLAKASDKEITLKKNVYWPHVTPEMAEEVIIKRPPSDFNAQTALQNDPWVNLIETSSLMKGDILSSYQNSGFRIWQRPIDKVFLIRMSKRLEVESGFQLFRYLRQKLNKDTVVSGLSGFSAGDQIFPTGYQLHDPDFKNNHEKVDLPTQFRSKPLEVMFCRARVSLELQNNIAKAFTEAVGVAPKFIEIDVSEQARKLIEGKYDVYVGTMGLADPDPEGVMSYYIDNSPSVIPKTDGIFVKRLDTARKEPNTEKRIRLFQKILTDATLQGYVIPLFHLSTIGVGRPELDFSQIPTSEESVTLSKVRFHGVK